MHWTLKVIAAAGVLGSLAACAEREVAAVPVVVERQPVITQPQVILPDSYYSSSTVIEEDTGWTTPPDDDVSYQYQRRVIERAY